MLLLFTLVIVLAVGYAQHRNGLFSSFAMLIQVVLAGLVAFNFWEPLASALEPLFQGNFLAGTEDLLALTGLFCLVLGPLRWATNYVAPQMIDYHGSVQLIGAGIVGMVTGYLVSGFLLCAVETLPLDEHFLGFEPRAKDESGLRSLFPADRVWLALMRHAGAYPLHYTEDNSELDYPYDRYRTFDREGSFELRYLRYRRHTELRGPLPYGGEFDRSNYRKQ
jgi:hypothetical protein